MQIYDSTSASIRVHQRLIYYGNLRIMLYKQIKHIFDWQITDEAQRHALADVVNGISGIEVTKVWGEGKTSGSDAQRFGYRKKTLHRTFSHKFNDFACLLYTSDAAD